MVLGHRAECSGTGVRAEIIPIGRYRTVDRVQSRCVMNGICVIAHGIHGNVILHSRLRVILARHLAHAKHCLLRACPAARHCREMVEFWSWSDQTLIPIESRSKFNRFAAVNTVIVGGWNLTKFRSKFDRSLIEFLSDQIVAKIWSNQGRDDRMHRDHNFIWFLLNFD